MTPEPKPKGSWNAEDYRRSADVHEVAKNLVRLLLPSEQWPVALGEDDDTHDESFIYPVEEVERQLRDLLKRAGAGLGDAEVDNASEDEEEHADWCASQSSCNCRRTAEAE